MREKLARFMVGRNGADALSKFFLYVALVLVVITMFSHNAILYLHLESQRWFIAIFA